MKTFFLKTTALFLLFFFINCATTRTKNQTITSNKQPKENQIKQHFDATDFSSEPQRKWVDSIFRKMTFEEKVGQLFMVAAYSNKDSVHLNAIEKLIKNNKIGGLIFFQGGPVRQAKLTNKFQSKSKIPLFIGIDAEWGLNMRLDSTAKYPFNMTLGAIEDLKLIEKMGQQMGQQSHQMGIHFNFAPVVDINTNPRNPIIGFRSFGEDKIKVTSRAIALMKGVQSQNVFSTAKHFPGHGDSETDSHKTLPSINFSRERLEEVEFYPYKKMFSEGLISVMVAHLNVPALEPRENYPSSISYNVVTNILQKELGFKGLIFTDALNMKGASNFKKPGEIDLEAFLAGNDILLFPENVPLALEKFWKAKDSLFSDERLTYSVKKILKYKFLAGLNHYKPIDCQGLIARLNAPQNDALQYQLYENAVTVLKNTNQTLPIKNLETKKIAYVKLGDDANSTFVNDLKKYADITEVSDISIDSLNAKLKPYNTVIVGFHKSDKAWKKQDISEKELIFIDQLSKNNNVILDFFAKPYALAPIKSFENIKALVVSYQNNDISQEVSAELLFGAIEAKGKLPVSINDQFKNDAGLRTNKLNVLGFSVPENQGINSQILNKIDTIANQAISKKITPGMQILVARNGKIIYQKSFGYHTYDNIKKVENSDLYDVASLTKILSTLPNIMQLYDQKQIRLDSKLSEMLPDFANTNKANISFKELLSHYGQLEPWIPFYKNTLDEKKFPSTKYYRTQAQAGFSKKVAENIYIRNDYQDSIYKKIADSPLLPKKEYKYSDFAFILLKKYLEKVTGTPIQNLSQNNIYLPLGANNTTYNPLEKIDKNRIVPTEIDNYFRHQLLQGNVHDMEAAMEGGAGGHAGIFSNANDVAKIMQMFLQKGNYGGHQFFSEKTFNDFNTCYFCLEGNRRGLGFDKPHPEKENPFSLESFGHSGFTGTLAWADPENQTVFVFLSNRTFPDSNAPNLLSKENIREQLQQIIKDAIVK